MLGGLCIVPSPVWLLLAIKISIWWCCWFPSRLDIAQVGVGLERLGLSGRSRVIGLEIERDPVPLEDKQPHVIRPLKSDEVAFAFVYRGDPIRTYGPVCERAGNDVRATVHPPNDYAGVTLGISTDYTPGITVSWDNLTNVLVHASYVNVDDDGYDSAIHRNCDTPII